MITYARTENNIADSYIYLFDEPGTYLHPHAQLDLQRTFESISNRTQIIYTTHSLFLINKNYPGRNRVVSKSKNGTQIDQKPFVKNWKAVRDSLGIILSNNFLIAEKTLLVEGPSDVIYILQAIKKLKKIREVDIDLNDLSIVDAGSSENYLAMAKIMANEGREIIALMDGDKKGEEIEKQLTKVCEKEIKDKKLHFLKLPQYKSIEDLFTDVSIMQKTIEDLSLDLISLGIRKLQPNLDLKAEIKKIVPTKNQTFGKIIEEKTTKMFDPGDKLSKLSIALKYEENITESSTLSEEAKNYIGKIKAELSLKNEENSDKLIFEDA